MIVTPGVGFEPAAKPKSSEPTDPRRPGPAFAAPGTFVASGPAEVGLGATGSQVGFPGAMGLGGKGAGGIPQPASESPLAPSRASFTGPKAAKAAPLPKRPKGRWFVTAIMLAFVGGLCGLVWQLFLRYEAYGVVEGRVIRVAAPWEGVVRSVHVREGDRVQAGQSLLLIENVADQQRLARLSDELRIAQADLEAKSAELRLNSQLRGDLRYKAQAEYFQTWGALLQEESRLADLQVQRDRLERLHKTKAVSEAELESVRLQLAGQQAKLAKLKAAVGEMQKRVDNSVSDADEEGRELRPKLIRIETLQAEINRLRQQIEQGQIRAPAGGLVIRSEHFAGERLDPAAPAVQLLEQDSLEVVLYLRQSQADALRAGQRVQVLVEPGATAIECLVRRISDQFTTAPKAIERHYLQDEHLLSVHLEPCEKAARDQLRLGGVVRLPRDFVRTLETSAAPEPTP